ncbi:MAG: tetratricopeptide repeat protein [Candidatus Absconditabacterales bacterium]
MSINLIQLLEQFKKFIQQENGSGFSLLLYLLMGLFMGEWILNRLEKYDIPKEYMVGTGICIIALCVAIWRKARKLPKKAGAINIGIADVSVIALGEANLLGFEQKAQLASEAGTLLSTEINNVSTLMGGKTGCHIIKLPGRIMVDFDNDRRVVDQLGLDVLVWGTLKVSEGQYFLNYKLTFGKKVESWAFTQMVQNINNFAEVEFDIHGATDHCSVFIKQLLCIGTLLQSIDDLGKGHYLLVNTLVRQGLEYLNGIGSDELYPAHYLLRHLLHYVGMKNNRQLREYYIDIREDTALLESTKKQISYHFEAQLAELKSYHAHMERSLNQDQSFQLEWLHALSKKPDESTITSLVGAFDGKSGLVVNELLSGYISMYHGSLIDAKLVYQSILIEFPGDLLALRSLGLIEYGLRQFATAKMYLQQYVDNQKKHIFYTNLYDTKAFYTLAVACIKTWHLMSGSRYFLYYGLYSWKNRSLRKKYIIL